MNARASWLRKSGFAIGAGAMALVLFLGVFAMFVATVAAQRQQQQIDTICDSLTTLADLRTAVSEAEVGVDDYVLSGGVTGAQFYQDAQARVSGDMLRLANPQGISASARQDIAQIQRLTTTYLTDLQSVVTLEQAGQTGVAIQRLSVGYVEQEVRTLRGIIMRIQTAENRLLQSEVTSAEEAQRLVTTVFIVTTLVDIASFAAILILVRRTSMLREQFAEERIRAEERARAIALEETNRRMTDFLGVASHEIRTPLTSLKISLQLSAREVQRTLEKASQRDDGVAASLASVSPLLDRALASTGQLERLATDLVDATRIEGNALVMRPSPLDLYLLVADCVAEQRLYHPRRTITLSMPDGAIIVMADTDRIRQVVTNFLANAIKFSDEERPVEVKVSVDDQEAMVRVRDEGPGIPPEDLNRVWEQFYRAPGILHRIGSSVGFGLGLYICKGIIERHGGMVGVESVVGQGSTFWFTLPLAITAEGEEQPAPPGERGGATLGAADPSGESVDGKL